ncbi:hypothetical protein [Wandonia haliotis]|uniref:hypothetical protein n=1 Tax=Wandonia haliotis TaxID=574963 RepID=UPI0031D4381B
MPIVIKEIQVKTTVQKQPETTSVQNDQLVLIKREVMREVKEYLRREHLRKYER